MQSSSQAGEPNPIMPMRRRASCCGFNNMSLDENCTLHWNAQGWRLKIWIWPYQCTLFLDTIISQNSIIFQLKPCPNEALLIRGGCLAGLGPRSLHPELYRMHSSIQIDRDGFPLKRPFTLHKYLHFGVGARALRSETNPVWRWFTKRASFQHLLLTLFALCCGDHRQDKEVGGDGRAVP